MHVLTPSIPCIHIIVSSLTVAEPSGTTVRGTRVGPQGIVTKISTSGPTADPSPGHGDDLAGDPRAMSEPDPVQVASPASAALAGAHGQDHPQSTPAQESSSQKK